MQARSSQCLAYTTCAFIERQSLSEGQLQPITVNLSEFMDGYHVGSESILAENTTKIPFPFLGGKQGAFLTPFLPLPINTPQAKGVIFMLSPSSLSPTFTLVCTPVFSEISKVQVVTYEQETNHKFSLFMKTSRAELMVHCAPPPPARPMHELSFSQNLNLVKQKLFYTVFPFLQLSSAF